MIWTEIISRYISRYTRYRSSCICHASFNTLRPRQNGRHFVDDFFKCIFLNENVCIPIRISLKFVPKGPINNIPALVQMMAWRRPGDKPLSVAMMANLPTHICVSRPQCVKLMTLSLTSLLVYHVKNLTYIQSWPLKWRHNGRDGVSNHQPHSCLLNSRVIRRRSKKTSKLCVTGLCAGNSPVTGEFPAQMASNVENVSTWWRHHASIYTGGENVSMNLNTTYFTTHPKKQIFLKVVKYHSR